MRTLNKIKIAIAALFVGLLGMAPLASFSQNENGVTDQGESTTKVNGSYVNENGKFVCWPRVTSYGKLLKYAPIATTDSANNITGTAATLYGNVLHDGWCGLTVEGFEVSTDLTFTTIVATVTITSPTFTPCDYPDCTCDKNKYSKEVSGLTPGTHYYYRAYATNDCGTGYGDTLDFTTDGSYEVTVTGPSPVQFCPGGSQSGTYTASVNPAMTTPTYQWYLDGVAVSGETSNTYMPTFSVTGTHTVKCEITEGVTTVDGTKNVTVSTFTVPSLTISGDASICAGATGNLTATTGFSSYAWSSNVYSSSANTATYTAAGTYTVAATTSDGCTATASTSVTVNDPQVASATGITGNTTICSGSTTTLTANATASTGASLQYQWKKNGTAISGATSASYTTEALTANTSYSCDVTAIQDGCTSAATELTTTVTIEESTLASVSITPSPVSICAGETATLTATASGNNGTLSYQWKQGSTNVGTNNASYTTPALSSNTTYTCVVTNTYNGCTISQTANETVNVYAPSVGTLTLADATVCHNTNTTLTVSSTGSVGTLSYQWATGGSDISGETSNSYTTPNLTADADYTVYVTATISSPVTCTVTGSATATVNVAGPYTSWDTLEVCDCQLPFSYSIANGSDIWTEIWTTSDYLTNPTRSHNFHTSAGCDSTVYLILETWDAAHETPTVCSNINRFNSNEQHTGTNLTAVSDFDGNVYKVVQIGNQCWLKENLRSTHFANGRALRAVYNNSQADSADIYYALQDPTATIYSTGPCDGGLTFAQHTEKYGLLYNWYTAMGTKNPDYNMHNVQGICPDGWHLPDTTEWHTLEASVGITDIHPVNDGFIGNTAVALSTGCEWKETNIPNAIGNYHTLNRNASGFSARPAGCFLDVAHNIDGYPYPANTFAYTGIWCFFWSSTRYYVEGTAPQYTGKAAYNYDLHYDQAGISRDVNKEDYLIGRSVRCLRDAASLKVRIDNALSTSNTTAQIIANVWDLGETACDERGVCWSTSPNPTVTDSHLTNGNGMGSYTINITGLTDGVIYYVRAYAHDAEGYVYSNEITLPIAPPTVLTADVTNQSSTSAKLHGNITSVGSTSCEAGICLGTSANPTTADTYQHVTVSATGDYSVVFSGLTPGQTYHYRAYASNASGDSYGADATFVADVCNGLATISDGETNAYAVVAIGTQCWTQTSMRATQYADGTAIAFGSPHYSGSSVVLNNIHWSTTMGYYYTPYNNNDNSLPNATERADRIQIWGYLYNWAAATRNGTDPQGICPNGWHIPTGAEWDVLDNYAITNYGCSGGSVRALCSSDSWGGTPVATNACAPGYNQSQNNGTHFTAYPAGIYNPSSGYVLDGYDSRGRFVNFWSYNGYEYTAMGYNSVDLDKHNGLSEYKKYAFSVRCVKD